MSNNRRSDVTIVNTFTDLDSVSINTCGQPEGDYFLTVKSLSLSILLDYIFRMMLILQKVD